MAEFKKLQTTQFKPQTVHETAEEKYWKRFKGGKGDRLKFAGPVTGVTFSPVAGFDFAVTSGTRVCIYDWKSAQLKRTLARFKDIAYGASFRHDGKLIAAGCKNSQVYVFNTEKGNLMRMFKGHKQAVRATGWAPTGSQVLTCSDDQTVRYWDVSNEDRLQLFRGHTDQVRSCASLGGIDGLGDQVWATGSYDHTVRLWDVRAPSDSGAVMVLRCDEPVEAVLAQTGAAPAVLAAAGNEVRVFDIASGGKVRATMSDHQRTVTSLFMDGSKTRVLSASLDGLIKVSDAQTYECVASVVVGTGQGILAASMASNNSTIVAGTVSGEAVIRRRALKAPSREAARELGALGSLGTQLDDEDEDRATGKSSRRITQPPRGGTHQFFMRGGNVGPSPGDFKVAVKRRVRLSAYDVHLKKFNYKTALDEALKSRKPQLVLGLLEELKARRGLETAIGGRDDTSLEPLLSFLVKFVTNPLYSSELVDVCDVVLNLYSGELGQSVLVDELFVKLQNQLNEEAAFHKHLIRLSGTLDLLLSSASG